MAARGFDRVREIRDRHFLEYLHKPRAATEGRPYSTFRGMMVIKVLISQLT